MAPDTLTRMTDEVRADPVELAALAEANLTASIQLSDGHRLAVGALEIPASAFGNATGAAGLHTTCDLAAQDLGVAVGRLVAVFEHDMDNLYQTAFSYRKQDIESAADLDLRRGGPR
jgi:hypothetical protein